MKFKVFISLVFCAAAFAVFLLIMGIICMDSFIFPALHTGQKVGNMTLKSGKAELDVYYQKVPNARGVVIYSHGNHEILHQIKPWLDEFTKKGYSILAYEYAGYGGSNGRAGVTQAISDIESAYNFLVENEKVAPADIIAVGYSVGSGPSTHLAVKYPLRKLVLIGPFASASKAIFPFELPFDRFKNAELLGTKKVKLVLFHGTADRIVPFRNSEEIYQRSIGDKTFKAYRGAGHKDIFKYIKKDFWQELAK